VKIAAYLLAGDPAWVTDSVLSYYDLVSRIVVAYDQDNRGWRGGELQVPEVLEKVRSIDHDHKVVELPGAFSNPERFVLDLDTEQRQAALDHASVGVDWVLQLDSDEVMASPGRCREGLRHADEAAADALDYPMRYFYQRTSRGRFLELSRRFWRPRANYPGPVAVRAGTRLRHCRQTATPLYRVDIRHRNTDPAHSPDVRVDEVVTPDEAIVHLWLVRTEEQMRRKTLVAGHADFYAAAEKDLERWRWTAEHPLLATLPTPVRHLPTRRMRITDSPVDLHSRDWYGPS